MVLPVFQRRKQFSGTDLPKYTQLKTQNSNPGGLTPKSWRLSKRKQKSRATVLLLHMIPKCFLDRGR